jgi:hypothetical protein
MPYDPYEDEEIRAGLDGGKFPLTVKFQVFGDRVRGVIVDIDRWDPPSRKPDEKPDPILKYKLAECIYSQQGHQGRADECEVLAGSVNLKGQLMVLRPQRGDEVDIEYVSDRKPQGSTWATKIFEIKVTGPDGVKQPQLESQPEPTPLRAVAGDDLFDRR